MDNESKGWMDDPSLKGIDTAKLEMLSALASQGAGKSRGELLPFLMAAASRSRAAGASFSPEETSLILNVLKQGKSPEEAAKIDRMAALVQRMQGRR